MSTPKENTVEDFLDEEVRRRGGFTVKLNPHGNAGIPDRLVVLPRGVILFVELKRPKGGVVARLQRWWASRIRNLGHVSEFVHTKELAVQVLDEYGAPR